MVDGGMVGASEKTGMGLRVNHEYGHQWQILKG